MFILMFFLTLVKKKIKWLVVERLDVQIEQKNSNIIRLVAVIILL